MTLSTHDPYQLLWLNVIQQALKDAENAARQPVSEEYLGAEAIERRRAYDWIEDAGPDFQRACEFAGLDPEYVRDQALKHLRMINPKQPAENAAEPIQPVVGTISWGFSGSSGS